MDGALEGVPGAFEEPVTHSFTLAGELELETAVQGP